MTTSVDTISWTIRRLLTWTSDYFSKNQIDEPRLSAELLLAHTLGVDRMTLYTRYDQTPTPEQTEHFRALVKRRKNHEPVAYLTGKAWFFSMEFAVSPAVLIPRPDTETLVEQAITTLRNESTEARLLDLCTGSGCAALAIAKNCPQAQITATDTSAAAIAIAEANSQSLGLADRITFKQGDLFEALGPGCPPFQVIIANPPYIPSTQVASLAPEISEHEPRLALDGGADGLQIIARIIENAPHYLAGNGFLLIETAFDQTEQCAQLLKVTGRFDEPRIVHDAARNPRCVTARLRIV